VVLELLRAFVMVGSGCVIMLLFCGIGNWCSWIDGEWTFPCLNGMDDSIAIGTFLCRHEKSMEM
jgi:hypothetical protein